MLKEKKSNIHKILEDFLIQKSEFVFTTNFFKNMFCVKTFNVFMKKLILTLSIVVFTMKGNLCIN